MEKFGHLTSLAHSEKLCDYRYCDVVTVVVL